MPKQSFISSLLTPMGVNKRRKNPSEALNNPFTPSQTNAMKPQVQQNPSATAAKEAPAPANTTPAKSQYVQSVAQQPADYSGITSSLQGINDTIGKMRDQQSPTSQPRNSYSDAMEKYLQSLMPQDDSYYDRYAGLMSKAQASQQDYSKRLAEIGNLGAGAVAGNLSTGTNVVGSGNAAIASQSASQRASALSDAQRAYLEGIGFESDMLGNQFERDSARRTQESNALKARAEYEQGLLPDTEVQKIGDALVRYNPETGAYEEVYSQKPESFELSEGQSRYEFDPATGQYREIASKGKTYAPGTGGLPATPGALVDAYGKPLKLTATQVDTISGFDNTSRAATEALAILQDKSKSVSSGPLAGILLQGQKLANKAPEDELLLEQKLSKIKADFMKAISGAAVSESEQKRLSKFLPDIYDQEKVLESKLKNLIEESQKNKSVFLSTLGSSGGVTNQGQVRSQRLASPNGQVFDATDLSEEEYAQALADGYIPR